MRMRGTHLRSLATAGGKSARAVNQGADSGKHACSVIEDEQHPAGKKEEVWSRDSGKHVCRVGFRERGREAVKARGFKGRRGSPKSQENLKFFKRVSRGPPGGIFLFLFWFGSQGGPFLSFIIRQEVYIVFANKVHASVCLHTVNLFILICKVWGLQIMNKTFEKDL